MRVVAGRLRSAARTRPRSPRVDVLYVGDARLHRHRGLERDAAVERAARARCRRRRCRRGPCRSARPARVERARGVARVHDPRSAARARAARRARRRSASQLFGGVRVVGLVGHREVRAHAREFELGCGRTTCARARARRSGRQPTRCIPVSTLRCTPSGCGAAAGRPPPWPSASIPPAVYTTGVRPVRDDRLGRVGHRLGQHEDRRVDSRVAQLDAFFDERDAEPVAPRVDRGARRPEPRRGRSRRPSRRRHRGGRHELAQRSHVGADGVEIDLGPDGPVLGRIAHVVRAMNRTRSARATMPTTLLSASTTGTCDTSVFVHDRCDVFERLVGTDRGRFGRP